MCLLLPIAENLVWDGKDVNTLDKLLSEDRSSKKMNKTNSSQKNRKQQINSKALWGLKTTHE